MDRHYLTALLQGTAFCLLAMAGTASYAQTSSLFHQDSGGAPTQLTLANSSPFYQPVEQPRTLRLNDLITVMVNEKTQTISEADVERRKQYTLNAQLRDFVVLDGLNHLKAAPQTSGDQKINGSLQGQARAQADLETKSGMKFTIAARVVDIRPNGHLVIEAHRTLRDNEEQWDQSLSGIVRPEDVLPNNTVLSEDIAELKIDKREMGHVRDGYRRGWFYKLLDKYGLF